jgi:transcriptional regulator with XRE-family HTH domain
MAYSLHTAAYRRFLVRLKEARQAAGLTQEYVAERLGKPQSWVSKSESGERRVDAVELHEFAKLYGISMDSLFEP